LVFILFGILWYLKHASIPSIGHLLVHHLIWVEASGIGLIKDLFLTLLRPPLDLLLAEFEGCLSLQLL
jgi:hypothetical protein